MSVITSRAMSRRKKVEKITKVIDFCISMILMNKTDMDRVNIAEFDVFVQKGQIILEKMGKSKNVV